MNRLARDGTAKPVSRDRILRRERGQGKNYFPIFPVQLTTGRIGNLTRFILTLAICDDHTCTVVGRSRKVIFLELCIGPAPIQYISEIGAADMPICEARGWNHQRPPGW